MHSNSQRRHRRSAVMQRIAGLKRALEQAQHLLHQDDLTPLLNRRGFRRACDRWTGNGPMAMSACCPMIDLDGLKAINERHGHPVGDAALVHFAATLRRQLRPADTIARLGGDEFALILMNCSGDDACLLLERLQQVLAGSPLSVPGGAVRLRFSAGAAELHAAESLEQVCAWVSQEVLTRWHSRPGGTTDIAGRSVRLSTVCSLSAQSIAAICPRPAR